MPQLRRTTAMAAALAAVCLIPPTAAHAKPTARGSIGEAYVVGAKKGSSLQLLNARGKVIQRGRADRLGSKIFRDLKAGKGYSVRYRAGKKTKVTKKFAVLKAGANPKASFYKSKRLKVGLNYVKMRDGIELAMTVRLPPGKKLSDGPFPTLIEYSGYQTAAPHDLLSSILASLGGGESKSDPLAPATSTAVGSVIAPMLGFAAVSVQMRGSGCSGGAFDLFNTPTTYDGYDAVETVAAQKWVKGGKVGMAGISFSGITQLFTGGTRPPHLAALTPMSVTDDVYTGTGYPGGISNSGFARSWIKERWDDSRPAPEGGQPWARELARQGDKHCRANQRLRLQTQDPLKLIKQNPFRTPKLMEPRSPAKWLARTTVPTFIVGQLNDEQTGGHWASSLNVLKNNPKVWITLQNGVHVDSLGPDVITRWAEFLKIYVAEEVPEIPNGILGLSNQLYTFLADAPAKPVQQSRFKGRTDFAAVKAEFERDPRVRVLMDAGAGPAGLGSLGSTWELAYDAWPVRQAPGTTFNLQPNGGLAPEAPATEGTAEYTGDPSARPIQTLPGSGEADAWKAQPPYEWAPVADGKGVGFTSAPLAKDVVIVGSSSVDLYLKSSAADTDLQVTLSEVRPDGEETFVQVGWLRASHRKLDPARSSAIQPFPTHLKRDAAKLPSGKAELVRVPVFPAAHAFRAGSRIRLTVQAPGGETARWRFDTIEKGSTRNTIMLGGATPSKLVLPVVEGATAMGTPLPAPTALRGEPSRRYVPAANGG
jgi:predicted acyl esterase